MEQREAERAAKTRIPTAFSLPNVGKSFANFQRGSARRRIGCGPSRSTIYFGWGVGVGFLCADALGPFTFFDKTEKGRGRRRRRRGGRSSIGKQTSLHLRLIVLPHRREFPLSFIVSQPAVTFSCDRGNKKKQQKKKQQNGCQTSEKRKNEAEGKAAPALCAFTVFCVLMKAECSNEGGKKKTLFSRTC